MRRRAFFFLEKNIYTRRCSQKLEEWRARTHGQAGRHGGGQADSRAVATLKRSNLYMEVANQAVVRCTLVADPILPISSRRCADCFLRVVRHQHNLVRTSVVVRRRRRLLRAKMSWVMLYDFSHKDWCRITRLSCHYPRMRVRSIDVQYELDESKHLRSKHRKWMNCPST